MSNGNSRDEKLSFKLPPSNEKLRKDRGRMTVKVLDAVECVHAGVEKFIPFATRLHSWTTIKVSKIRIDIFKIPTKYTVLTWHINNRRA